MPWFIGTLDYLDQNQNHPIIRLDRLEAKKFAIWYVEELGNGNLLPEKLFVFGNWEIDLNEGLLSLIQQRRIKAGDIVAVEFQISNKRINRVDIVKIR